MKKLSVILLALCVGFGLCACEKNLKIPKDYIAISDAEAFQVSVQYEPIVRSGSSFTINVISKNISDKDLYNKTCSSLYRIGAKISVYTEIDGQRFYLQDEFETLTDDVRIEKICKKETINYNWKFDGTLNSAIHGTELINGTEQSKIAPKGMYNILISTGEQLNNAFEIL